MANETIAQQTALAAAASDDLIPIWDTSASAYKYITVANLTGGTIVTTDDTQVLTNKSFGDDVEVSGLVKAEHYHSAVTAVMGDDTATSIDIPLQYPCALVYNTYLPQTAARRNSAAIIAIDSRSGNEDVFTLWQPSTIVNSIEGASELAGTTSTDGKLNLAVYGGDLYIENRTGSTVRIAVMYLGYS